MSNQLPVSVSSAPKRNQTWLIAAAIVVLAGGGWWWTHHGDKNPGAQQADGQAGMRSGKQGFKGPQPVRAQTAISGDLHVYYTGLGTVTPTANVLVKPRVDGLLQKVNFHEGQLVKKGDVLVEIDPSPFIVALKQQEGQLTRDKALLSNARLDLARYRGLLAEDSVSKQQVDTQEALVLQDEGMVKADQALVDNAKLQLEWTRVTAPVSGRVGLRQVDQGNMVHAADTTGLVYITEVDPITVIFTLPETQIPNVIKPLRDGQKLLAEAWDRDQKSILANGALDSADNLVDPTTGTLKFRAQFKNDKGILFPNQFVNVKLLVETRHKVTMIPTASIQRGNQGIFVYVVQADNSVTVRPVVLGPVDADRVAVESGVNAGEVVVIDGADKLREGAKVEVASPQGDDKGHAAHAKGDVHGKHQTKPQ